MTTITIEIDGKISAIEWNGLADEAGAGILGKMTELVLRREFGLDPFPDPAADLNAKIQEALG